MKGKHITRFFGVLVIFLLWLWLVRDNNARWNESMEGRRIGKEYSIGEIVPLGDSIVNMQTLEGCSVKVSSFEIVEYDRFLEDHHFVIENPYEIPYEKLGIVYLTIESDDVDVAGFPLSGLRITSLDSCQYIDHAVLFACNPFLEGNPSVSLEHHSSIDLILPFDLFYDSLQADWNRLDKISIYLRITSNPEEINIKIQ